VSNSMHHRVSKGFDQWMKRKRAQKAQTLLPVDPPNPNHVATQDPNLATVQPHPKQKKTTSKPRPKKPKTHTNHKRKNSEPNDNEDFVPKKRTRRKRAGDMLAEEGATLILPPRRSRTFRDYKLINGGEGSEEDDRVEGKEIVQEDVEWKPVEEEPEHLVRRSERIKGIPTHTLSYAQIIADRRPKFCEGGVPHITCLEPHELTREYLLEHGFNKPIFLENEGLVHLVLPREEFTLNQIVNLIGHTERIPVMEVSNQKEVKPCWTLGQWRNYFVQQEKQKLYNVISLEFSHTQLVDYIKSPQVVREMDWASIYWPQEHKRLLPIPNGPPKFEFPKVQYYCLMSPGGCYTDFHIDFGGSSVWYHLVSGQKIFLLIPPTKENLKKYEEWSSSPEQGHIFFPDRVLQTIHLVLNAGNTLLIPTGWIHAVYTPVDSIVFGGNFLHSFNISLQLQVFGIEERTAVPMQFRFPYYGHLVWYASYNFVKSIEETGEAPVQDRSGLIILMDWIASNPNYFPPTIAYHPNYIIDVLDNYLKQKPLPLKDNYTDNKVYEKLYCFCKKPYLVDPTHLMIGCDKCGDWFHLECVGLSKKQAEEIESYVCRTCSAKERFAGKEIKLKLQDKVIKIPSKYPPNV